MSDSPFATLVTETCGSATATDPLSVIRQQATVKVSVAAKALDTSTETIYRWVREGRLPAIRVGPKTVRIRTADLLAILEPR